MASHVSMTDLKFVTDFVGDGIKTDFMFKTVVEQIASVSINGTTVDNYTLLHAQPDAFGSLVDAISFTAAPADGAIIEVTYNSNTTYGNGPSLIKSNGKWIISNNCYAKIVSDGSSESQKDADGITRPNLHRRIDEDLPEGDTSTSPIIYNQVFNGNGKKTVFKITPEEPFDSINYVTVNNDYVDNYSVNNKTITFSSAPPKNSKVTIYYVVQLPNVERDEHKLLLTGTNSYRYTVQHIYDENSTTSEIP